MFLNITVVFCGHFRRRIATRTDVLREKDFTFLKEFELLWSGLFFATVLDVEDVVRSGEGFYDV